MIVWQKPTRIIVLSSHNKVVQYGEAWRFLPPRQLAICPMDEVKGFSIREARDPETNRSEFYLDAKMFDGLEPKIPPILVNRDAITAVLPDLNDWLKSTRVYIPSEIDDAT